MTPFELPLSPEPQKFTIKLAGTQYKMRFYWNETVWCFDLSSIDETPILAGVPVVAGADLLGQYKHLGIGGSMLAQSDFDPHEPPTLDNLGETGRVYFIVE